MFGKARRPKSTFGRRGMLLVVACALAGAACPHYLRFYTDCPDETQEDGGEAVPPCPEAGVPDAGLDAADDAPDDAPDGDVPDQ